MKKKRVNPHRRPATLADVQKAKKAAQNEAVTTAWAIFFSALRDKEGFGYTRLRRVWDEVNYLADSVSKGFVLPVLRGAAENLLGQAARQLQGEELRVQRQAHDRVRGTPDPARH